MQDILKINLKSCSSLLQKDDTLALLKHTVQCGWPQNITELPPELRTFWTFCEEIAIEDRLLLKGE